MIDLHLTVLKVSLLSTTTSEGIFDLPPFDLLNQVVAMPCFGCWCCRFRYRCKFGNGTSGGWWRLGASLHWELHILDCCFECFDWLLFGSADCTLIVASSEMIVVWSLRSFRYLFLRALPQVFLSRRPLCFLSAIVSCISDAAIGAPLNVPR